MTTYEEALNIIGDLVTAGLNFSQIAKTIFDGTWIQFEDMSLEVCSIVFDICN